MKSAILNITKFSTLGISLVFSVSAMAGGQNSTAQKSQWGPADEIGALNLMTDRSRADIMNRKTDGKVYDLGIDLFSGMPDCCSEAFGDPSYQMMMIHAPARGGDDELVSHSSEAIFMSSHTGTHIDTLNHFGLRGKIWNEVSAEEAFGVRGWNKSGAEKYPPIIARGVMIDVVAAKNLERLPASYSISIDDLKAALNEQGTTISPGDVVFVRTGQMTTWPEKQNRHLFQEPGLSLEAAQWLVENQKAMLLGADNFGLESFPSKDKGNFAPIHTYLLAEKGVSFIELLWLEDLARDQVYEFLFIGAPLKLSGASGAPLRPLAFPLQTSN